MKNDYFKQKLEATATTKKFKEASNKFRKKWKLPATGLDLAEVSIIKWLENILFSDNIPDPLISSFFQKTKDEVREFTLLNSQDILSTSIKEKIALLEKNIFNISTEFNKDIKNILSSSQLNQSYAAHVKRHLLFDIFHYFQEDEDKFEIHHKKMPNGRISLLVEIYPNTNQNDFLMNWEEIQKAKNELFGQKEGRNRGVESSGFRLKKRIYELYCEEKQKPKIIREILESEKFKNIPVYNEIPKVAKRFKDTFFTKITKNKTEI